MRTNVCKSFRVRVCVLKSWGVCGCVRRCERVRTYVYKSFWVGACVCKYFLGACACFQV